MYHLKNNIKLLQFFFRENKSTSAVYTIWQNNKKNITLFTLLVLCISFKNLIFKIESDHLLPLSYFEGDFFKIILYFLPLLLPSIVISSFIFLFKRKYWGIIIFLLIDLWAILNLIFLRSYDTLFSFCEISYVNNMSGSWSSLLTFWKNTFWFFPISSILFGLLFITLEKRNHLGNHTSWKGFLIIICVSIVLSGHRYISDRNEDTCPSIIREKNLGPIASMNLLYGSNDFVHFRLKYPLYSTAFFVSRYSLVAYLPMSIMEWLDRKITITNTPLPTEDEIFPFVNKKKTNIVSATKQQVIVLLVESFESWLINSDGFEGKVICPNIQKLIENNHCVYSPNVKSQTKYGNSGDGQMTILTGLLPIKMGAACELFGHNYYPSMAKLFHASAIINPSRHIWNQDVMNTSYGFRTIIEPNENMNWEDEDVIKNIFNCIPNNDFIFAITISSHVPFEKGSKGVIDKTSFMPEQLRLYMNAFHYADSCIGLLINRLESDTLIKNSTIVITGDHTIFKSAIRHDFEPYITQYKVPIPLQDAFVPFIIYSPNLKRRLVSDTIFQMDIYPTILSIIGCDNNLWKGLGVNVLDDSLRNHRPIDEEGAYLLSDKIIINDYFRTRSDFLQ